jgi:hypothetical protein
MSVLTPFLLVLETTAQDMMSRFYYRVGIPLSSTGANRDLGSTLPMVMVTTTTRFGKVMVMAEVATVMLMVKAQRMNMESVILKMYLQMTCSKSQAKPLP